MTVYLATGLTQGEAAPMDDERIDTRWFTRREIETAITGGRIADAKTLIGYYTWRHGRPEASRTRGQRQ
jgi:ADP-ribose pyrophosphatase